MKTATSIYELTDEGTYLFNKPPESSILRLLQGIAPVPVQLLEFPIRHSPGLR